MDVKLPNLGEGADSGTVVSILVKEGDQITKDQTLIELENEKAVAPIPSTAAGRVANVRVKEGDQLSVGQVILTLDTGEGDPSNGDPAIQDTSNASTGKPSNQRKSERRSDDQDDSAAGPISLDDPREDRADESESESDTFADKPVAAAPSIRRIARDLGIDLSRVRGSERGGRIVMGDLHRYVQRLQAQAAKSVKGKSGAARGSDDAAEPAESVDFSQWGPVQRNALTPLRKVIARRMSENWRTIPHVTQFDDADVTRLMELRDRYRDAYTENDTRLTVTVMIIKTVADALKAHPVFNSSLDEVAGELVLKDYVHIGIAVDTDAGLIVPVMRDVDRKSVAEIARELAQLAGKARDRKVSGDELKGGSFTISNQGGIGGAHFTPIINKPEVAILGLGRSRMMPNPQQGKPGKWEARTMLPLALSYDHRVIDGGSAARFVVDLIQRIESFPEDAVKI